MARAKALSPTAEKKLRAWEQASNVPILNQQTVVNALAQLEAHKCDSETLILVLELGRIYDPSEKPKASGKREQTTKWRLKGKLEERHADATKAVDALRADARAIEHLELTLPDAAATSKKMIALANQLEGFAKYMKFVLLEGLFGRGLGMTLWNAVFAAELIERKTGSPHYSELVEIFATTADSSAKMNVVSFSKKIKRFRKRNPDFIAEKIGRRKMEDVVREWIREWKEVEVALERKAGGSKSHSKVQSSESKVRSSSSSSRHTEGIK